MSEIFVDPFINEFGEIREYSDYLLDFKPHTELMKKIETDILENPEKISLLDKNAISYQFMEIYYSIITGTFGAFHGSKIVLDFNPRTIELFKERIDVFIKDQNNEDFLYNCVSKNLEVSEIILDYCFDNNNYSSFGKFFDSVYSHNDYEVDKVKKYFVKDWVIKEISENTNAPFWVDFFIRSVLSAPQKTIDYYVDKCIRCNFETFLYEVYMLNDNEIFKKVILAFENSYSKQFDPLKILKESYKCGYYDNSMKKSLEESSEKLIQMYVKNDFSNLLNFYFEFGNLRLFRPYVFFENEHVFNPFYNVESVDLFVQTISKIENKNIIIDKNKYLSIINNITQVKNAVCRFMDELKRVTDLNSEEEISEFTLQHGEKFNGYELSLEDLHKNYVKNDFYYFKERMETQINDLSNSIHFLKKRFIKNGSEKIRLNNEKRVFNRVAKDFEEEIRNCIM